MANIMKRREETLTPSARSMWDPFRALEDWLRGSEMARVMGGGEEKFYPTFEVKETKGAYLFKADLPGLKEADLDIALTGNRLTVSGKREAEKEEEGERYYAFERSYGSFTRSFTLPEGIDAEHVDADLKDGVLTLTVPKRPEVQAKKISVKSILGGTKAKA
jgi:HSP20 family protein